jgi:SNF2 family DNA or RNA helicase
MRIEPSTKPSTMSQASKRTDRIGQKRAGFLYDFVTKDTADEKMRELLAVKTDQQMEILTAFMLLKQ